MGNGRKETRRGALGVRKRRRGRGGAKGKGKGGRQGGRGGGFYAEQGFYAERRHGAGGRGSAVELETDRQHPLLCQMPKRKLFEANPQVKAAAGGRGKLFEAGLKAKAKVDGQRRGRGRGRGSGQQDKGSMAKGGGIVFSFWSGPTA